MSLLNPNLRGFFEAPGIRNYVLYGGRASSKTYHTAAFCVFLAVNYRVKFLCVRQFQNRTSDSVKTVIEECIYKMGAEDQFSITDAGIEHKGTGSSFRFLGIQRNLKEIKGIAGIDVLWIEEAEDLTEEQWEILEPTIREDSSKIFIVFNPRFSHDFVYQRFVIDPPRKTLVRKINYDENPYLSDTMHDIIEEMREKRPDEFEHIYLGVPRSDDDKAIIKRTWLESAIDAHKKLGVDVTGAHRVGFDVADDGDDKNALTLVHGILCKDVDEWKGLEDELLKSCTRVYQVASQNGASIDYDSIGVGATAGAKFSELNEGRPPRNRVEYHKFNAGGKIIDPDREYMPGVLNKDQFSNLKAQAWWLVADRLRKTHEAVRNGEAFDPSEIISISSECSHLERLFTELATPHRDFDPSGKVKVESKKDLAKRDVKSPNLADSFIMAYAPRERGAQVGAFIRKRR